MRCALWLLETVEAIRTRLLTIRQGTGGLRGSAALLGQRDATLVSLLAYAGLRPRSEALGLRWGQVRDRTILVHASKTGRSRSVRLLGPLARDLAEWRLRCGRPGDSALVFPGRDHDPWSEHSYRRWRGKVYEPAAIACGAEEGARHPYALRHSFASLLIAEGQTVVEVAEQLGHSPKTCLDVYAHVLAEWAPGVRVSAEERIRQAREPQPQSEAV